MFDFFPFQETFERDINEGLDEERVTSAFFILNLMCASDTRRIETIAVVYTTNWGEMFCKTFVNPAENVASMPFKFLTDNLDHSVPSPPLMTQFVPKGAQCKRLTII
jgi:adenylate cyclase class 1